MGASRLFQLARILNVTVSYFFEDLSPELASQAYAHGLGESGQTPFDGTPASNVNRGEDEILHRRETLELIRAYYRINDSKQRRKIYELIKAMADSPTA